MKYLIKFETFNINDLNQHIDNNTTFVRKSNREINNKSNNLSDHIKKYDFSGFSYTKKNHIYEIKPDNGFKELYQNYCKYNNFEYQDDLIFNIDITEYHPFYKQYNMIDIQDINIPKNLMGLGVALKLYVYISSILGFVTSNDKSTKSAKNLWYNLLLCDDIYAGVRNDMIILIYKHIDDNRLNDILQINKEFNFKYDNELLARIK